MSANKYGIVTDATSTVFEFYSEGPMGRIKKGVAYQEMEEGLFNLLFGDSNESGDINDASRTNNGDRDKVIITVGYTILSFLDAFPWAKVFIEGRTASRTRLYQMTIARYLEQIKLSFEVSGLLEGNWIPFALGLNFQAFLISRK